MKKKSSNFGSNADLSGPGTIRGRTSNQEFYKSLDYKIDDVISMGKRLKEDDMYEET
ncbi:hypothetical protein JXL83_10315 [candidate division WOR-3 bacterium]|nr:hypothetical protein [candidate division WOR-3 bacterium]